jgi:transcriptional regulator with XRE-family HTH domain
MAKKEEVTTLTEQLRNAIRQDGRSLNVIGKACGVSSAQLSRFMTGTRSLSLPTVEKICAALHLRLTPEGSQRKRGG